MIRRYALPAVLLVVGLMLWAQADLLVRRLEAAPQRYEMNLAGEEALSRASLRLLLEEEEEQYVFARQKDGVELTASQFGRTQEVTLLETAGDPTLLFPHQSLLAGNYPPSFGQVCALDDRTAQALWGDVDVLGKTVRLEEGEVYEVCGVFSSPRPVLVTRWRGREEFPADYGVFVPAGSAAFPRQELDRFLNRNALPGTMDSMDIASATSLLGRLTALPLAILCLMALSWCIRGLLGGSGTLRKWARGAAWAGGAVLLCLVAKFSPIPSPESLPTRWSDFSFWKDRLKGLGQTISRLWLAPGGLASLIEWQEVYVPALCYAAGSLFCVLLFAVLCCRTGIRRREGL